jgi:hypothetical protein
MQKTLRITFEHLPPRPRGISPEDLSRIFGGCLGRGSTCTPLSCCPGLECQPALSEYRCLGAGADLALSAL